MALHELLVQSNAIDVAINGDASLIAVLHHLGISLFEWKNISAPSSPPVLTGRFTFEKTESPTVVYEQITFADKDEVLVTQRHGTSTFINYYGFNNDTGRMHELSSIASPSPSTSILSSFVQDGSLHPFIQGSAGDLHSLAFGDHSLSHCNFPTFLPWVEIVPIGNDFVAFGMSSNGHLYANATLLVKNCTSFLITAAHLIFTTTTHLIKFVHITHHNGNTLSSWKSYC